MASIKREHRSKGTAWVARVRLPEGRALTKTFTTKGDAERWAAGLEGDKARGALPANLAAGRTKLAEWAEEWLATRPLRSTTSSMYRTLLDLYILPTFGNTALRSITPAQVRRWYAELARQADERGTGKTQVPKSYRLLRTLMSTAVADGLIVVNPCNLRGAGQERAPERPLVEVDEVWALADAIAPHLRALVLLAGLGGLRRGELLALRRRHVDLLHRSVTVESQIVHTNRGQRLEAPPKTDAGRRTVCLPQVVADELEAHLGTYTPADPDAYVFVGEKGGPLSTASLYPAWYAATDALGWPRGRVRLHDLRHAAATLYATLGATQRELMAHVGHASPAAAMRYQHVARSRAELLADRLDEAAREARAAGSPSVARLTPR